MQFLCTLKKQGTTDESLAEKKLQRYEFLCTLKKKGTTDESLAEKKLQRYEVSGQTCCLVYKDRCAIAAVSLNILGFSHIANLGEN